MLNRVCVVAASALLVVACGDAGGKSPNLRGIFGGSGKHESNGDVVIAAPTTAYRATTVATPGSVSGWVSMNRSGATAESFPTGNASVPCGASVTDDPIEGMGRSLGSTVVWLDGIRAGKPFPDDRRIELESVDCRLRPRVQAALTGSAVNIIGHDEFRQHLKFTAGGESAARATVLVGGGEQVIPTELPLKGPGLVLVRDPDHKWTQAYLAVFDNPYFAVTASNGHFVIDNVPPGRYKLHVWHERAAEKELQVDVTPNGAVRVDVDLSAK